MVRLTGEARPAPMMALNGRGAPIDAQKVHATQPDDGSVIVKSDQSAHFNQF